MQDARVGSLLRAIRIKRGWRQADVARAASVSSSLISEVEAGRIGSTSLRTLRAIAAALGATIDLEPRWRGGDADRLLNEAHTRLHESVARFLDRRNEWAHAPEVAFAIGSERGVIDIVAFHATTGSLLVIELETELTDLAYLLATTSRRVRLGPQIAAERGWRATSVSAWVVVAESRVNRRLAARFGSVLRSALPADGHAMRTWIRRPVGRVAGLSFWSSAGVGGASERFAPRRRVRVRGSAAAPGSRPSGSE